MLLSVVRRLVLVLFCGFGERCLFLFCGGGRSRRCIGSTSSSGFIGSFVSSRFCRAEIFCGLLLWFLKRRCSLFVRIGLSGCLGVFSVFVGFSVGGHFGRGRFCLVWFMVLYC